MTDVAGQTIGLVGALSGLPRRMAAREVAVRGGRLRRGATRAATMLVFGRTLISGSLARGDLIEEARASDRILRSENGFLRVLARAPEGPDMGFTRAALAERSGLASNDLDRLALFDAFETDREPFSFADLILARKYAGLIASGADWISIARSLHRAGPVVSLVARSLEMGDGRVCISEPGGLTELDGQMRLDLATTETDADALFLEAEAAETARRYDVAASLFGRCLAMDPEDAVAAFNQGNCLRSAGRTAEAEVALVRAVTIDPGFVEAWFNLAGLLAAHGRTLAARAYFERAIELDSSYGDAIFNLAALEFEAGDLSAARSWWERYLLINSQSEWARRAERGVQFATRHASSDAAG